MKALMYDSLRINRPFACVLIRNQVKLFGPIVFAVTILLPNAGECAAFPEWQGSGNLFSERIKAAVVVSDGNCGMALYLLQRVEQVGYALSHGIAGVRTALLSFLIGSDKNGDKRSNEDRQQNKRDAVHRILPYVVSVACSAWMMLYLLKIERFGS